MRGETTRELTRVTAEGMQDRIDRLAELFKEFDENATPIVGGLKYCYLHLIRFGGQAQSFWDEICRDYPYDNSELNRKLTEALRGTWDGRATLLSLFTGIYVTFYRGCFLSCYDEEYEFINDAWIGRLAYPNGEKVPFVDFVGVQSCKASYLVSDARVYDVLNAVSAIADVYKLCEEYQNPDVAWKQFLTFYDRFAYLVDTVVFPMFDVWTTDHGTAYIYESLQTGKFVPANVKRPRGNLCFTSVKEFYQRCAEPMARLLSGVNYLLISY